MSALEDASARARRLYPRAKGLRTTYVRGAQAAIAGRSIDSCPYPPDPGKTWGRGWRAAWLGGYLSVAPAAAEGLTPA